MKDNDGKCKNVTPPIIVKAGAEDDVNKDDEENNTIESEVESEGMGGANLEDEGVMEQDDSSDEESKGE